MLSIIRGPMRQAKTAMNNQDLMKLCAGQNPHAARPGGWWLFGPAERNRPELKQERRLMGDRDVACKRPADDGGSVVGTGHP